MNKRISNEYKLIVEENAVYGTVGNTQKDGGNHCIARWYKFRGKDHTVEPLLHFPDDIFKTYSTLLH